MSDISALPDEDKAAIKAALLQWKKDGNENPLLPLDQDLNGDGITDAFGLDDKGELILVPGVEHADTVSVANAPDDDKGAEATE